MIKIPHKFSLCAVLTTKILIAGQAYKVTNAIFIMVLILKRIIIRVCVEKEHLALKLMMRKI